MKHSKCKPYIYTSKCKTLKGHGGFSNTVEEIAGGEKTGDGTQTEACTVVQEVADILNLRHIVRAVTAVVLEQRKYALL